MNAQTASAVTVKVIKPNVFQVNTLKINTTLIPYLSRNLAYVEEAQKRKRKEISDAKEALANLENEYGILTNIKHELSINYYHANQEVRMVRIASAKTGKIVDSVLIAPEQVEVKLAEKGKWMRHSDWSEMYPEQAEADGGNVIERKERIASEKPSNVKEESFEDTVL